MRGVGEAGHRIRASLFKLENVVDVDDIAQAPSVTRELALIKVAATPRNRAQIFDLVEVFRARIVDLTSESLMIEMTGVESKIEGLIEVLREDEGRILEICRSGKMTMRRGHHASSVVKAMGAGEVSGDMPRKEGGGRSGVRIAFGGDAGRAVDPTLAGKGGAGEDGHPR